MGVDSGLATFRGRNQESKGWGPIERGEETPYSMCKPRRFDEQPALAWGYAVERYKAFFAAEPHEGYSMITRWSHGDGGRQLAVFTSNIDSHWHRTLLAQAPTAPLVEYHGSMRHMQCHKNCRSGSITPVNHDVIVGTRVHSAESGEAESMYPPCEDCGALQRFNVCLIADTHFSATLRNDQQAAFDAFVAKVQRPVVLEIGAGLGIPTVRQTSERIVSAKPDAVLVRINVDDPEVPTHLAGRSISMACGALDALQAIHKHLF